MGHSQRRKKKSHAQNGEQNAKRKLWDLLKKEDAFWRQIHPNFFYSIKLALWVVSTKFWPGVWQTR